jgi:predicted phage terminase large subunit-like protein
MVKKAYVDTADTGKDYLCAICYVETETANYITDVYYTQQAMEVTEPKTAEMLTKQATKEAVIEANNGGRGFSRSVENQCRIMNNNLTTFKTFHQSENKQVRIFTHSAGVQNITHFPVGWDKLWPQFYRDVTNYMKVGKNDHDDAVDALTGTFERRDSGSVQDLAGYF